MTDNERAVEMVLEAVGPEEARYWSVRAIAAQVVRAIREERAACAELAKGALDVLGYDASAHGTADYIHREITKRGENPDERTLAEINPATELLAAIAEAEKQDRYAAMGRDL